MTDDNRELLAELEAARRELDELRRTVARYNDMGPAWLHSWWFPWVSGFGALFAGLALGFVLLLWIIPALR